MGSAPFIFFLRSLRSFAAIKNVYLMRAEGLTAAGTAPAADPERQPE